MMPDPRHRGSWAYHKRKQKTLAETRVLQEILVAEEGFEPPTRGL